MKPVCLDSSFLIRTVVEAPGTEMALELLGDWVASRRALFSSTLMPHEAANALHRYVVAGELTHDVAVRLLSTLLHEIPITLLGSPELHMRAMELAHEFGLKAAYDAQYLAVAEELGAEFWTADKKLSRSQAGQMPFFRLLQ